MSGSGQVTVVVADDHPIWRDAVERDLTAAGLSALLAVALSAVQFG